MRSEVIGRWLERKVPEWKSQKASQKRNAIGVVLDERTLEVKDCGSEEEITCP